MYVFTCPNTLVVGIDFSDPTYITVWLDVSGSQDTSFFKVKPYLKNIDKKLI